MDAYLWRNILSILWRHFLTSAINIAGPQAWPIFMVYRPDYQILAVEISATMYRFEPKAHTLFYWQDQKHYHVSKSITLITMYHSPCPDKSTYQSPQRIGPHVTRLCTTEMTYTCIQR